MASFGSVIHGRWRRLYLLGVSLLALAGVAYVASSSGGRASAAAPALPPSVYSALNAGEPSGITLATAHQIATTSIGADGPVWRSEPGAHGSNAPLPATIRPLTSSTPTLKSWIAESTTQGVCILLSPSRRIRGTYVVGATCTRGPSSEGTYLTYQYPDSADVALAGVAPNGVTSVVVTLADGASSTVPVKGNAWTLSTTTSPPMSILELPGGSSMSLGGE